MRALLVALLCGAIGFSSGFTVSSASAAQPAKVTQRLHRAIDHLPVAAETRKGYDRSRFKHWVDADGDCQDTRDEVLAAESLVAVSGCDIQRGKWLSYYDGVITALSTGFDVDHLVPLAEAWDSGAKRWNAATRRAVRERPPRRAHARGGHGVVEPLEVGPRPGRVDARARDLQVRPSVGGREDPLEAHGGPCREASPQGLGRGLQELHDHGAASSRPHHVGRHVERGASSGGDLDPRFDYCYQATAAGYGPYYKGTDPEYDWYTDGDSDGIACE